MRVSALKFAALQYMLLTMLALQVCYAHAEIGKEKVIWLTPDLQDFEVFYQDGPFNIANDTSKLLINSLPDYDISLELVSLARIERRIKSESNVCVVNRIKNKERLAYSLFSLPINSYPDLKVYALTSSELNAYLADKKLSSIYELFQLFPSHILGTTKGRSYGAFFDQQIAKLNPINVYQKTGEIDVDSKLEMLINKRIQYFLEFPAVVKREKDKLGVAAQMITMQVKGSPDYIFGHLSCSKSSAMKAFLADVNEALKRLYLSPEFILAHTRYVDPSEWERLERLFKDLAQQP